VTDQTLQGRLILVTGASRGIGHATALEVARRGGHVIALARTQGALEELDDQIRAMGNAATLVVSSVTDGDGLDHLGGALFERYGKLDGLVINAATLGPISPVGHISPKEFDTVIATNLTAAFRLIRSMDPLLRRSDGGRLVSVSSGVAKQPRAYWGAYAASKAGLDALISSYAAEVQSTAIRVNMLNPGATRTRMRAKAMPGEDPSRLPGPEVPARLIADLLSPAETRHGAWIESAMGTTRSA
jgi:NAD(P)-dependent dehydrogenase (short-subunit alcohol dehydrogenase family)